MIELTVNDLINSTEAIQKLLNLNLKAKTAYQVMRLAKAIEEEYNLFNQSRMDLIEKYGEKNPDNSLMTDEKNNYIIKKEQIQIFSEEYEEVLNAPIVLNVEPISIDDLQDATLTANDMIELEKFLKL